MLPTPSCVGPGLQVVPEGAFAAVPRLRHVSVASGIRFVGAEAWQCCRQLQTVKMPVSVVSIADNAFRGCQLLTSVTAPGCLEFATCPAMRWPPWPHMIPDTGHVLRVA